MGKQDKNIDKESHEDSKNASNIKSIEFLNKEESMVDLEVEGTHDFYANGILVHNCVGTAKFKGGLRKAFICPDKSYVWVTADYSQEELRLAGIFSGEPNIIEPIKAGKDLHLYIAEKMFGFADPSHRTRVKTLNFGVLYGAQKYTVARKLGCAIDEAQKLLDHYFKTLWHLDAWLKECHKQGRRTLMAWTYFGRPRLLGKYYNSSDKGLWGFADRTTVSHLCQGPVVGSTRVLTNKGYLRIDKLHSSETRCWTGIHWANYSVVKQGVQPCYKMKMSDGTEIVFSENHRFLKSSLNKFEWLETIPEVGDTLAMSIPFKVEGGSHRGSETDFYRLGENISLGKVEIIPEWVFSADENLRKWFILGVYSHLVDDNLVECKGNKRLALDLKEILASLGMRSKILEVLGTFKLCVHTTDWYKFIGTSVMGHYDSLDYTYPYLLEQVISIEKVEPQEVYCLYVHSEEHSFVTSGLISHNCSPIETYLEVDNGVVIMEDVLAKRLKQPDYERQEKSSLLRRSLYFIAKVLHL